MKINGKEKIRKGNENKKNGKENGKVKGVNRGVVRGIRHKEFIDVFFGRKMMRHKIKRIQSKLHRIRNYDV